MKTCASHYVKNKVKDLQYMKTRRIISKINFIMLMLIKKDIKDEVSLSAKRAKFLFSPPCGFPPIHKLSHSFSSHNPCLVEVFPYPHDDDGDGKMVYLA